MKTKSVTGLLFTLFLASIVIFATPAAAVETVELSYDDGSWETHNGAVVGYEFAVNFSLPAGWTSAKILTARYYISVDPGYSFRVCLYDSYGNELITPFSVTPTAVGWFNVDLSGLNIVVSGYFYIAIEWMELGKPRIGFDTADPDWRSYWGAEYPWNLSPGVDYMIRAVVESPRPSTIESCDSIGTKKDIFYPGDTVYVNGSGYSLSTTYDIYVVNDVGTWNDGMAIPARVSGTATSVSSDSTGDIPPTPVWSPPLTPGKYDIVVDVNENGYYDENIDALDDMDVNGAGFLVIPEYWLGTILGLAGCFAAFGVFFVSKRRRH